MESQIRNKKTNVLPAYIAFLVLFVVSLVSYTLSYWTFAIVAFCVSLILLLLAITGQLIDNYPGSKIYFFTILFVLSAPLAIYSVALILKANKSGLVQVGLSGDWIGFAGSVIGGAMTLFALIFTIQHELKLREEEEELRLMPYIECTKIGNHEFKLSNPLIDIHLTNLSNNPARKIKAIIESSTILINQIHYVDIIKPVESFEIIEYLPPNQTKRIVLEIDLNSFKKKDIDVVINLEISFSNQLLKKEYVLDSKICCYFNKYKATGYEIDEEDPLIKNEVKI